MTIQHKILDSNGMLLLGGADRTILLYSLNERRLLLKLRQQTTSWKFSSDGKQIVSGTKGGYMFTDSVRGYIAKFIFGYEREDC